MQYPKTFLQKSTSKIIDIRDMRLVMPNVPFAYLLKMRNSAVMARDLISNPWQKLMPQRQANKMIKVHTKRIACIDFLFESYGYEIL